PPALVGAPARTALSPRAIRSAAIALPPCLGAVTPPRVLPSAIAVMGRRAAAMASPPTGFTVTEQAETIRAAIDQTVAYERAVRGDRPRVDPAPLRQP
ncbi:MAG TPA: hypothetical protein VIX73_02730, partial [Kofleriaceae bacterium]